MDIVLLGAPGVGKGTQAELLVQWLKVPHISSGELFRAAIAARTELGLVAKGYIDRGELVPDAVTVGMVAQRIQEPDCAGGTVLDGFPRTVVQAEALDGFLTKLKRQIDIVLYVQAAIPTLLQRLGGRWTCRKCNAVYHDVFSPERVKGQCDLCGGTLYQREDDTPEAHKRRIEVYLAQTAPLVDHYRRKGLLVEINGERDIQAVQAELREAIRAMMRASTSQPNANQN